MDQHTFTTLVDALAAGPDPRTRRGQRDPWIFLLTLGAAAWARGQQHGRAIGQWVQEPAAQLRPALDWRGRALPGEATVRRVWCPLDLVAREGSALWAGASSASHTPRPPRRRGGGDATGAVRS